MTCLLPRHATYHRRTLSRSTRRCAFLADWCIPTDQLRSWKPDTGGRQELAVGCPQSAGDQWRLFLTSLSSSFHCQVHVAQLTPLCANGTPAPDPKRKHGRPNRLPTSSRRSAFNQRHIDAGADCQPTSFIGPEATSPPLDQTPRTTPAQTPGRPGCAGRGWRSFDAARRR